MDLPKAYQHKEVEDKIYQKWEKSGYFQCKYFTLFILLVVIVILTIPIIIQADGYWCALHISGHVCRESLGKNGQAPYQTLEECQKKCNINNNDLNNKQIKSNIEVQNTTITSQPKTTNFTQLSDKSPELEIKSPSKKLSHWTIWWSNINTFIQNINKNIQHLWKKSLALNQLKKRPNTTLQYVNSAVSIYDLKEGSNKIGNISVNRIIPIVENINTDCTERTSAEIYPSEGLYEQTDICAKLYFTYKNNTNSINIYLDLIPGSSPKMFSAILQKPVKIDLGNLNFDEQNNLKNNTKIFTDSLIIFECNNNLCFQTSYVEGDATTYSIYTKLTVLSPNNKIAQLSNDYTGYIESAPSNNQIQKEGLIDKDGKLYYKMKKCAYGDLENYNTQRELNQNCLFHYYLLDVITQKTNE